MEVKLLSKENRIFKNLYNEHGWEIDNALKRDDWSNTNNLISKGRDWIIDEIKISSLEEEEEQVFHWLNGPLHLKKIRLKATLLSNKR